MAWEIWVRCTCQWQTKHSTLKEKKKKSYVSNLNRTEKVHWGQTPFRVNVDHDISQLDAEYDPELSQSDPVICQVCRKLTDFWVFIDPEWSLASIDPFRVMLTRGFFRVSGICSGQCPMGRWRHFVKMGGTKRKRNLWKRKKKIIILVFYHYSCREKSLLRKRLWYPTRTPNNW